MTNAYAYERSAFVWVGFEAYKLEIENRRNDEICNKRN